VVVAGLSGIVLIAPTLPEIGIALNVSEENLGLAIAAYTFPAALFAPIFGSVADRYGRREVLIPNLILFGVTGTLLSTVNDFSIFVLLRAMQGVGVAGMSPLAGVLIGDLFEDQRQVEAMGAHFIATNMTVVTLSPIVGILAIYSWRLPFLIYLLTIPLAITIFIKLDAPKTNQTQGISFKYVKNTLRLICRRGVVAAFLMGITRPILLYGPYLTYSILWIVVRFDASPFVRGLLLACMQLVAAIFASQGKWLDKHIGRKRLPPLGLILYAIALGTLPFTPSLSGVFLSIAIFGAGHGILLPHVYNYLNEVTPTEYRGGVLSTFNTFFYGGQTLGPILFGIVFAFSGKFTTVFFLGSLLALVSAFIGSLLYYSAGKMPSSPSSNKENET